MSLVIVTKQLMRCRVLISWVPSLASLSVSHPNPSPSSRNSGIAIRELESHCLGFLVHGRAAISRRTYAAGQRKFWQFIQSYHTAFSHRSLLPASEYLLMRLHLMVGMYFVICYGRSLFDISAVTAHRSWFSGPDNQCLPSSQCHARYSAFRGCGSSPYHVLEAILLTWNASSWLYDVLGSLRFGIWVLRISEFTTTSPFNSACTSVELVFVCIFDIRKWIHFVTGAIFTWPLHIHACARCRRVAITLLYEDQLLVLYSFGRRVPH